MKLYHYLDAELAQRRFNAARHRRLAIIAIPIILLLTTINFINHPTIGQVMIALILIIAGALIYRKKDNEIDLIVKKYRSDESALLDEDYDALQKQLEANSKLKEILRSRCESKEQITLADAVWLWSQLKNNPQLHPSSIKSLFK